MKKTKYSSLAFWGVMIFLIVGIVLALLSEIKCDASKCSFELLKAATCYCYPWSSWTNKGCGADGCSANKMHQVRTRTCIPSGCNKTQESRCYYLACTNECSSGQRRCSGTASYQICDNYDSDCCLEWSSLKTCSGSTSCDYGNCVSSQRPKWYCSGGNCVYSCYYDSSCCAPECSLSGTYFCSSNNLYWCKSTDGCLKKVLVDNCNKTPTSCGSGKHRYFTCVNGQSSCQSTCR